MTLNDSSAAPGDSRAEEAMGAAYRAQPRQVPDPAVASPGQQGLGARAEGWGLSLILAATSLAVLQQVGCLLPRPPPTSVTTSSGRAKAGQRWAEDTLPWCHQGAGLLLRPNSCSSRASCDFLGNCTLKNPVFSVMVTSFSRRGGRVKVSWANLSKVFPCSSVHHLGSITR